MAAFSLLLRSEVLRDARRDVVDGERPKIVTAADRNDIIFLAVGSKQRV